MDDGFNNLIIEMVNENKRKNQDNEEIGKRIKMNKNLGMDKYKQDDVEYLTIYTYFDKERNKLIYELEITFLDKKTVVIETKNKYYDDMYWLYIKIKSNFISIEEQQKWVIYTDQSISLYINHLSFVKTNYSNNLKEIYNETLETFEKYLKNKLFF